MVSAIRFWTLRARSCVCSIRAGCIGLFTATATGSPPRRSNANGSSRERGLAPLLPNATAGNGSGRLPRAGSAACGSRLANDPWPRVPLALRHHESHGLRREPDDSVSRLRRPPARPRLGSGLHLLPLVRSALGPDGDRTEQRRTGRRRRTTPRPTPGSARARTRRRSRATNVGSSSIRSRTRSTRSARASRRSCTTGRSSG